MSDWKFQRDAIAVFRFVRCELDVDSGVASLVYAFDEGPELVETITLPGAPFALDDQRAAAAGVRQIVLLAAGLDSRAYRLDWPDGTVIYEPDQPQVLEFKREVLAGNEAEPKVERREIAVEETASACSSPVCSA